MNPNPSHLPEEDLHAMQLRRNTLLLSRGDGTFAETARQAGLEATDWSVPYFPRCGFGWLGGLTGGQWPPHGCAGFGCHRAASTAAGWIPPGEKTSSKHSSLMTSNVAFRNGGDSLNFTSVGEQWVLTVSGFPMVFCMGDLDFDGDMDLVINCLNDQALVYRNSCSAPCISVRLVEAW